MICDMIHYAFVELRLLGWGEHGKQAADLADAFTTISKEMYGWGGFSWDFFAGCLEITRASGEASRQSEAEIMLRYLTRYDVWPNKSPEPTAVGAVSSAIAVHVASRRWLSFFR